SGERVSVDAAGPGSFLPLRLAAGPETSAGYAASRLIVCIYPYESIDADVADEKTLRDLFGLQQQALDRLERIAAARGRHPAVDQVHTMMEALRSTMAPLHEGVPGHIDLSPRVIAHPLRPRTETVCRALRSLERERVIERSTDSFSLPSR